MHPLIGITSDLGSNSLGQPQSRLNAAYSRALAQAGAVPVIIPSDLDPEAATSLVSGLDGILFSGGGDIEPWRYQGDASARLIEVSPARDALELGLARMVIEMGKPFLGICRGCQVVNVALGGTLYEDLDAEPGGSVRHNVAGKESPVPAHAVRIASDTLLGRLLSMQEIGVNSHHHQGLREVPTALRISARAADDLPEAVELPEHPFGMAVQWHPEWLTHQEWTQRLFQAFTTAADRAR